MMAYGQTNITEDLYAARDAAGGQVIDEAADVQLHDLTSGKPYVTFEKVRHDATDRLRLHRRLRRLARRQPRIDPGGFGEDLREELSVRLARHHVGDAALSGDLLLLSQPRLCARLAAQSDAQPLLHPVRSRHQARRLAGRPLLGRIQGALSQRHGGQHRHRPVDRKIHRAAAQFCLRADALRRAVPGRRCRPYRAADRRQGPQPRGLGCFLSVARADRSLSPQQDRLTSTAIPTRRCAASGAPRACRGG